MRVCGGLPLLILACAGCLSAATSICHEGFTITTWQTEDGLPQNTVTAITQTRDGYLWVATMNGLARFDGVRFVVFNGSNAPGLRDGRITALYEDAKGGLWIGHDEGDVTLLQDGEFRPVTKPSSARDSVHAIMADAQDQVWILRRSGRLERIGTEERIVAETIGAQAGMLAHARTGEGATWVAVDGTLFELREGRLIRTNLGPASHEFVYGIGVAANGGLWVARNEKLRTRRDGRWVEGGEEYPWQSGPTTQIIERRGGGLAIGTVDHGLYLYSSDGRMLHLNHRETGIQNWARAVYEDREGNLWVGAGSGGLTLVRTTGLTVVNAPDGWLGRTTLSIAEGPDKALWIGTEGAGLYRWKGGAWTRFAEEEGLGNPYVWSLGADVEGRMLAGTWHWGVLRVEQDRLVTADEFGNLTAPVIALRYSPEDRTHWVGTGAGLLRVREGRSPEWLRERGKAETFVCAIERDAQGVIWLALPDRGLGRVEGEAITVFGRDAGLSSDSTQCLLVDGDSLWIGTRAAGLNRLRDGRFSVIDRSRGLLSDGICHIADDGRGHLWLSTQHGIMRVAKEDLHRCADGLTESVGGRVFDKSDGLPMLEFSGGLQASGCRTSDGRLWFTSHRGVLSVDPAAVETDSDPPPVVIESLRVDGARVPDAEGELVLAPGHQRLEFRYTALTFAGANKARFKHRLVGLDREWIDAGATRVAAYSQLPRGKYRFEVIGCNQDSVWNHQGAALAFAVLPFYWQTWWFRGAEALLALSAAGWFARFVTRRRMQRRMRELEFERGIEKERARIAQDIHDDIGSSLTRISMLSQSVQLNAGASQEAAVLLNRIRAASLEVTAALDEIVWAVNPQHDSLDSLLSYLAKFAQEALAAAGIRCRLDLPVHPPAWTLKSHVRHNLILAFKEALNNAIKHSGASEVHLALTLQRDSVTVILQDNGRGFDPAQTREAGASPTRGNGLGNLRRRLEQLGGRGEIQSQPGAGTRIAFILERDAATLSTSS